MGPRLRGGILLALVLIHFAEGCPLVPNIQPRHLEGPIGARELARWGERLRGMGAELSDEELAENTLAFSTRAREIHSALMSPFSPAFDLIQVHQKWSLFPIADPDPWWMFIEGRQAGGQWEVLYRPLDDENMLSDGLADRLSFRRIRAHWNPGTGGPRADYGRFVDWIAKEIFAEQAELVEVRVRYQRFHVEEPGEARSDEVSWHFEERRSREASL